MTATPPVDAPARTLLGALRGAAPEADASALAVRLYEDLRSLARGHRARWRGNETLNATALAHEAYLKVAEADLADGDHFLAVASRAMRQVLVNYARDRAALKRGGGAVPVRLDDAPPEALLTAAQAGDLLDLDDALARLGAFDARAASVVELKFFGGLSLDETAAALGVSEATVTRDWRRARAWLRGELADLPADLPTLV